MPDPTEPAAESDRRAPTPDDGGSSGPEVLDVTEWASEVRRLLFEPKTRAELRQEAAIARRRRRLGLRGSRRSAAAVDTGTEPADPSATGAAQVVSQGLPGPTVPEPTTPAHRVEPTAPPPSAPRVPPVTAPAAAGPRAAPSSGRADEQPAAAWLFSYLEATGHATGQEASGAEASTGLPGATAPAEAASPHVDASDRLTVDEPEFTHEPEPVTGAEPEPMTVAEPEPADEVAPEPEAEPRRVQERVEPEPDFEDAAEPDLEPEPEHEPRPEPEVAHDPEPVLTVEPELESAGEPEAEPELVQEPVEPEAELVSEVEPERESASEPEAEPELAQERVEPAPVLVHEAQPTPVLPPPESGPLQQPALFGVVASPGGADDLSPTAPVADSAARDRQAPDRSAEQGGTPEPSRSSRQVAVSWSGADYFEVGEPEADDTKDRIIVEPPSQLFAAGRRSRQEHPPEPDGSSDEPDTATAPEQETDGPAGADQESADAPSGTGRRYFLLVVLILVLMATWYFLLRDPGADAAAPAAHAGSAAVARAPGVLPDRPDLDR